MDYMPWGIIGAFATVKGLVIAVVTVIIGTDLGSSLLVAIVSGGLGVIGMVLSAMIAARAVQKNSDLLHDVKKKIDAAKRRTDTIDERDIGSGKTERGGS